MEEATLDSIPGIDSAGIDLLSAVGVEGLGPLAKGDPGMLLEEMKQANRHLELVETLPDLDEVISWVETARELAGEEGQPLVPRLEQEVELVPIEVLQAIPVKKENIVEHQIAVSEVPEMTEFLGKEDLVEERVVEFTEARPVTVPVREISGKEAERNGDGAAKENVRVAVEPLKRNSGIDLRKTASPELNVGKKVHSRSYIRGVLHPQPGRVKLGAFFTFFTLILLPLNFVAGILVLILFKGQPYEEFLWLLAIPVAFFVFGFFYLILAKPVKCRVCGQPLFSPKLCRRNPKAHHIPLLGYILPTVIQLWIFHWFRCMYCGTSVRLKE